jgi:hypothetical protein
VRNKLGDLLLTSNLPFGDWVQIFQGERMTAALLDRLTHKCHIFEMNGESYRFRESMKAKRRTKNNLQGFGSASRSALNDSANRRLPANTIASHARSGGSTETCHFAHATTRANASSKQRAFARTFAL